MMSVVEIAEWAIPLGLGAVVWTISSLAGGGGALMLLPLAGALYGIDKVIPALSIAGLLAGGHRVVLYREYIRWDIARWLLPGMVLGALVGAWLFVQFKLPKLRALVGLYLLFYVIWQYRRKVGAEEPVASADTKMPTYVFFVAGSITSTLSALMGAIGAVLNPLYIRAGALKEAMIGTKGLSGTVMQSTKALAFGSLGAMGAESLKLGIWMGFGAMLGNLVGKRLLAGMKEQSFIHAVNAMLLISGFWMFYRAMG